MTADRLPQARAIVEVIGHDGAVLLRGRDRLDNGLRGGLTQRSEDPSGVQPAHPELAEEVVPVHVPGLEVGHGGVAAVGDADRPSHAEAALGEVQPVARPAPDPVAGHPCDEGGVQNAGQDEVFNQAPYLVVRQSSDDRGAQPEGSSKAAGDVVLPATGTLGFRLPSPPPPSLAQRMTVKDAVWVVGSRPAV